MKHVFLLSYKKEWKNGSKTNHTKIGESKEVLFEWIEAFCKEQKLVLTKSENPDHEFLFIDGDWVYYGKSDLLNVEFCCYKQDLLTNTIDIISSVELKGFKTYRHESNPVEEALHNKFIKEFNNGIAMEQIALPMKENGFPVEYLTDREKQIMISTIQWLGSPVGQSFLGNCGFDMNNNAI